MGPGGSQEAEFTLKADVPAGTYAIECDAIVIRAIDVTFDLVHRRGQTDTTLATWMQHFEPLPGGEFGAQPFEIEQSAQAIDWQEGDQFIFRYSGANSTSMQAFIPNGDGAITGGRIPNITLPK